MNEKFIELLTNIKNEISKNNINIIKQYYEIGKLIIESQDNFESRNDLVIELSNTLPDGYKKSNLADAKKLYEIYKNLPEQFESAQRLSWLHNKILLSIENYNELRNDLLKFAIENKISSKNLEKELLKRQGEKKIENEGFTLNIESIEIKNFKSLVNVKISKPNNFTVFVGPNAVGKSNLFEAIEMLINSKEINDLKLFENYNGEHNFININNFENIKNGDDIFELKITYADEKPYFYNYTKENVTKKYPKNPVFAEYFYKTFSRLFANNSIIQDNFSNNKLSTNTSNLNEILMKILNNDTTKEEITNWLELFIPGFEKIQLQRQLDGSLKLLIYEKNIEKPIQQHLISEGTRRVLSLLTAIYQSDKPQFLCIEEPENGLNPKVKKELVSLFRTACEERGHYIWITTHSQTLVDELNKNELIVVDKIDAQTILNTDFRKINFRDIKLGEAWINGLLKGGIPW